MPLDWSELEIPLTDADLVAREEFLAASFAEYLSAQDLPEVLNEELVRFYLPLATWLVTQVQGSEPLIVGVNGAQGSGKSTLCSLLAELLDQEYGLRCCVLSIDDLYLTEVQRQKLARQIHPLLATRGVPGTHDVELGLELFKQLRHSTAYSCIPIPRFDKAVDDRFDEESWDLFCGRPDVIFFEGWCVGAFAQNPDELVEPINRLESLEDPEGRWRGYVNQRINEDYARLFEQLDLLLMLKIPRWEMVSLWRGKQEAQLAGQRQGAGVMDKVALERFIMHYERLTRHLLAEMPSRADLVFELDDEQRVVKIIKKAATA